MTISTNPIQIAISTCPNDTFAFAAMMNQVVDWRGLQFEFTLLDIAQLNQHWMAGSYDVSKVSFHAALKTTADTVVLPSGSALGFGVGPLLLSARQDEAPVPEKFAKSRLNPTSQPTKTLCPGPLTTATLLFDLFYPRSTQVEHTVFSDIMPRLENQTADFGVCIHEGRFTWSQRGLFLVEDLGARWEQETGLPLPLGGIVAKRSLANDLLATVQQVIADSIEYARAHPESSLPTMRQHAQEFSDAVLMQHVELYVNDWTVNLGPTGQTALEKLSQMAASIGLIPASQPPLAIFSKAS